MHKNVSCVIMTNAEDTLIPSSGNGNNNLFVMRENNIKGFITVRIRYTFHEYDIKSHQVSTGQALSIMSLLFRNKLS